MKKEKVLIGLPISFMKKGDTGYMSYEYVPLVYDEKVSTNLSSLKLFRLISKDALVFRFSLKNYVRVTKINDGNSANDYYLVFPIDFAFALAKLSSINRSDYFEDLIEVDWEVLHENSIISQDLDLSTYTYTELCELVNNYCNALSFSKVKQSAYKILEYVPLALIQYLKSFDGTSLPTFYQQLVDDKEKYLSDLPSDETRFYLSKFYDVLMDSFNDYFLEYKDQNIILNLGSLTKDELKDLLEKSLAEQNFELAAKIRDLLK